MKLRPVWFAVVGAVALHAPAWAGDPGAGSSLAPGTIALDSGSEVLAAPSAPAASVALASGFAAAPSFTAAPITVLDSTVPLPGGGSSERRLELARSSSNLFPMMAFLQLTPGDAGGVMPYFGVGGGYNVMFLSADDFQTGNNFSATYGGWGWQAWG